MSTKERKHPAPPRYDEAFKAGAVRMVTEQGRPSREVAAELGICIDTLRSWLKAAGAPSPGQADRQNRDARRLRELETEIRALRKKLEEKDGVIDILKKIRRHTFQTIEDKYRYIRTARAGASVELVCRLLEVSRSGYYEWLGRKPSLRRQKDQELKRRLLSLHQRYPALGLDSLYHLIRPQLSCSRKRIHRLMYEMNISSTRRRAYKATTNSRHAHPIAPNLLARRFSFDKPDTAWVGDITYIPTGEGWLYCAVVKDLCTKQIVGYAFSDRIDTNLTLAALGMAVRRRKPLPGLIFHSDRGVQYAAYAYRQRLASLGIRQSMSRKGDPYDNAVAENFFSCLKCECVHLRHFASRAHAMADVFAYIETFYNPVRPHSSIGWRPPDAFARALSEHPAA